MREVADGTKNADSAGLAKSQTIQKPGRSEHSNADKIKKRRTVANSVTSVGESGDPDRCVGASVASLGVNTRP